MVVVGYTLQRVTSLITQRIRLAYSNWSKLNSSPLLLPPLIYFNISS